ncbi:hypothetical protein [Streptomyces sp. NPDC090112]|uniref:hypothetical protein n=1 Tax=Streptomyces sp. NPDC090112 TaxID=3365949 RepID=UPI0038261451
MSTPTARINITCPVVPDAPKGTLIGAAEVLDHGNRRLARVPLRAGMSTPVDVPRDERCLVHGWSPYLPIQPLMVTGGTTRQAQLSTRRALPDGTPPATTHRGATGWVQLWVQDTDGHWTVRDPSGMSTGRETSTVATPPGGPAILQIGGPRRRPVCTLVPEHSLFTLEPTEHRPQDLVHVRPIADSGFTLLEALRLGEWTWAALAEQVWWDNPGVRGAPLFDLAVAYAACRRGDQEAVERWHREAAHHHGTGPAACDVLVIEAWLARRRDHRPHLADVLERLTESPIVPLASEGTDLLHSDLVRPTGSTQATKLAARLSSRLRPLLRSSLPSSLTTFTAAHPERPEPRPDKGTGGARPLPFRVDKDATDLKIRWRALNPGYRDPRDYGLVADAALSLQSQDSPVAMPPQRQTLIIEDAAPIVLWMLSRTLLDEGLAADVAILPNRDAVAVTLLDRPLRPLADLLARLVRTGTVEHLNLSLGAARSELNVADNDEAERILEVLVREGGDSHSS